MFLRLFLFVVLVALLTDAKQQRNSKSDSYSFKRSKKEAGTEDSKWSGFDKKHRSSSNGEPLQSTDSWQKTPRGLDKLEKKSYNPSRSKSEFKSNNLFDLDYERHSENLKTEDTPDEKLLPFLEYGLSPKDETNEREAAEVKASSGGSDEPWASKNYDEWLEGYLDRYRTLNKIRSQPFLFGRKTDEFTDSENVPGTEEAVWVEDAAGESSLKPCSLLKSVGDISGNLNQPKDSPNYMDLSNLYLETELGICDEKAKVRAAFITNLKEYVTLLKESLRAIEVALKHVESL